MKYKAGDKVRVRNDLKEGIRYDSADKKHWDRATPPMIQYAGKIVTIAEVHDEFGKYNIEGDGERWNWTDEMFEDVSKFKVGDKVIGCKEASKEYGITGEGWIGEVTKICSNGYIYVCGEGSLGPHGFKVEEKYFDFYDELVTESHQFKVGDRVKVLAPTDDKTTIVGKIGTIIGFINHNNRAQIEFDENINGHSCACRCKRGHGWNCDIETLSALFTDEKIVITTDGKTTTAKLYEGKKFVKSAEAKCSPEDKFDFERGSLIAFARLTGCDYLLNDKAEEKPEPKYNGKVVCIDVGPNKGTYTVGKIYQFVDGAFINDKGMTFNKGGCGFASFKEFADWTGSKFIEVVE